MEYSYRLKGTCASTVKFDVHDNIVTHIRFIGGCSGNTQGVARLAEGMSKEELISRLKGIRCGMKPTSCPDQFAKLLEECE